MSDTLFTLNAVSTHLEEIKKSRFEAVAAPATSVEQALKHIEAHSDPTATHNCWAWRVGDDYRFNDAGEPAGTAGRPILQAIDGQQCDQVVVLVKRWFGGVKLGTGGLVRAYGGVAAQCLRLAKKTALVDKVSLELHCPFPAISRMQACFSDFSVELDAEEFDENGVLWRIQLPQKSQKEFSQFFADVTRGQGLVEQLDDDID